MRNSLALLFVRFAHVRARFSFWIIFLNSKRSPRDASTNFDLSLYTRRVFLRTLATGSGLITLRIAWSFTVHRKIRLCMLSKKKSAIVRHDASFDTKLQRYQIKNGSSKFRIISFYLILYFYGGWLLPNYVRFDQLDLNWQLKYSHDVICSC